MKPIFRALLWLACNTFVFGWLAAEDCSFWVWHRRNALSQDERQVLEKIHASLLWHVGELDLSGTIPSWRWRDALPEPDAIPVVRLNLSGPDSFAAADLADHIARLSDKRGRLQIDCDCPDRLLGKYAQFLGALHKQVPHLTATALAGWIGKPGFEELQASVEALDVMFYDLAPDPRNVSTGNPPRPLLDERAFQSQLASWQNCKVPWRAGLPNYSRVTVFDSGGRSLGQIRNWNWDEVIFQPHLKFVSAPAPGMVLMNAVEDLVLADTPIKAGSLVAIRWVDREVLARCLNSAKKSNASGIVFFRLPDSSDPSGWTMFQLNEIMAGRVEEAKLSLKKEGDFLALHNDSPADLPPRIAGDADRGYALEVDAPVQLWRDADAGDFLRVAAHANPDNSPVPVPVAMSTRLTFWFGSLKAGQSLKSGLIQLAPDANIRQIRYRILPGDQSWKPLQ